MVQEAVASVIRRVEDEVREQEHEYANGEDRPILSYAVLMSVYGTSVIGLGALVRRRKAIPERIPAGDLALMAVASHKLSRLITKDSVTATVRAPFTRYEEPAGEGEVNEEVRGTGLQHAVGELLSCPFCMSVWVATGFTFAYALAPRATRMAASMLTAVTASDYLQFAHSALQRHEHES